jgi:hypothetical protein
VTPATLRANAALRLVADPVCAAWLRDAADELVRLTRRVEAAEALLEDLRALARAGRLDDIRVWLVGPADEPDDGGEVG